MLRLRNISDKRHKEKTHILCSIKFFQKSRALYEIAWKNMEQPARPQMTI